MFQAIKSLFTKPGSVDWMLNEYANPRPMCAPLRLDGGTVRLDPDVDERSQNYNRIVFAIDGGQVVQSDVLSPVPVDEVTVSAGQASSDEIEAALKFALETVDRCAPWVIAILPPRVRTTGSGYNRLGEWHPMPSVRLGGLAAEYEGKAYIFVSTDTAFENFRRFCHHELWHQIENRLSDRANAELAACLSPYGYTAGADGYTQNPRERMARAYAYYALQADDMGELGQALRVEASGPLKLLYTVFAEVYSGEYARQLRARDLI